MENEVNSKFIEEINKLIGEFGNSTDPQYKKLTKLAKQVHDNQKKFATSISGLEDALSNLRIHVKYLVFDLEATRRENMHLRRLLEDQEPEELTS